MKSTATLKSLSRATGFSVTTVSRALGGYDDVNAATREQILAEAARQGYEPNLQARLLKGQRSQTLGLVIPTPGPRFSDPFFSEFVAGVGSAAATAGFDLLISTQPPTPDEVDTYRRMVNGRRVDGLILARARREDARIDYLLQTNMPFVVFGRTARSSEYVYIDVDGIQGQRSLTEHFIALGHRRIAYITPSLRLMFAQFRLQGFTEALAAHGLDAPSDYQMECDLTETGGYQAAEHLLSLPEPPTAIMTGNDTIAFGVMSLIQQRGLRVGDDIAVGGFDDIPAAEHVHPGLTTMHQPIYHIGQQLASMVLEMLAGHAPAHRSTLLNPELIIRGSSGPPRPDPP